MLQKKHRLLSEILGQDKNIMKFEGEYNAIEKD